MENKPAIISTNSASIMSKRSVEHFYKDVEHDSIKYFEPKLHRRSPIINRGYWIRMKAIDYCIKKSMEYVKKNKDYPCIDNIVIVNLGCGYDSIPYNYIHTNNIYYNLRNVKFIDVDYPDLMKKKVNTILETPELYEPIFSHTANTCPFKFDLNHPLNVYLKTAFYAAIGCDLKSLDSLKKSIYSILQDEDVNFINMKTNNLVIFLAEVSITYMNKSHADALIEWTNSLFKNTAFILLEQLAPDSVNHPFTKTMLNHFNSLDTPLKSISSYPTLSSQINRFKSLNWKNVNAIDLQSFWSSCINYQDKVGLLTFEPFDEWEEFFLFCQHYFILYASSFDFNVFDSETFPENLSNSNISPKSLISYNHHFIDKNDSSLKRRYAAACNLNDDFAIFHGGLGTSVRLNDYFQIYPKSTNHNLLASPLNTSFKHTPCPRVFHAIASINISDNLINCQALLLCGGRTNPSTSLNDTWLYYKQNNIFQWLRLNNANLFQPRTRHSLTNTSFGVLLHGGVKSDSPKQIIWLLYENISSISEINNTTWAPIEQEGDSLDNCNYSRSLIALSENSGILIGGVDNVSGDISNNVYFWKLSKLPKEEASESLKYKITIKLLSQSNLTKNGNNNSLLNRFGAQILKLSNTSALLLGGVSGVSYEGLMRTAHTGVVINLVDSNSSYTCDLVNSNFNLENIPLLVSFNMITIKKNILILGGGAVCFSFGSFWNDFHVLTTENITDSQIENDIIFDFFNLKTQKDKKSQSKDKSNKTKKNSIKEEKVISHTSSKWTKKLLLENTNKTLHIMDSLLTEWDDIYFKQLPAVFRNVDIGPCKELWTSDYLKEKVGPKTIVTVHSASEKNMSFAKKNFSYTKMKFGDFIDRIGLPNKDNQNNMLYLRSISSTNPRKKPTILQEDFPSIANDITIPFEEVKAKFFSSPLRITSPGLRVWLHYDVTANILVQIKGSKLVKLYPPSDVNYLKLPHAGSSSLLPDVFNDSPEDKGLPVHPFEVLLNPGDVLFIPSMWLHATKPIGDVNQPSISVNYFWKDLDKTEYSLGKDIYGNKDLAVYENSRLVMKKVNEIFETANIPNEVKKFYLYRLSNEIRDLAEEY